MPTTVVKKSAVIRAIIRLPQMRIGCTLGYNFLTVAGEGYFEWHNGGVREVSLQVFRSKINLRANASHFIVSIIF